jgi:c-di-GMP-binding flagellar brake protein YcgR
VETPRSTPGVAELILWSNNTYDNISENFNKAFLAINNKKNMRSLTKAQVADLEKVKLDMLLNLKPLAKVTEQDFKEILHANKKMPNTFKKHLENNKISTEYMSIDEYKRSAIASYVDYVLAQK